MKQQDHTQHRAIDPYRPARRETRTIRVGDIHIGGAHPVVVQSMTNTDTRDAVATIAQIRELAEAGAALVRCAVPDMKAAEALRAIREASPVPLVADIHFDHKLALAALEAGVQGLRINPGNIGTAAKVDAVVDAAKAAGAAIRIGVNSGSVEKELLAQYGGPTPEAMVESALKHVALLEKRSFHEIKISLKSSSVMHTVAAYRILADRVDYPLHIGVTEAGTLVSGSVKSAVGLGVLLYEGVGDTLRVSLTHDPVAEVGVAWQILRSLGLGERGPEIISCPTCGRTEIDLIHLAEEVEARLRTVDEVFTVAVMGCVVNGPGEAKEADIGIAGGRNKGIIFKKGEVVRTVRGRENLLPAFLDELDVFLAHRRGES
ncbi:4-hydroxy-3-methylbut-2-en-1-yl diphosphate synthase [Oceanidesulfovibrio indonesiensis]|uniref:4-hydroxy-3-methylbut-2-en-1-yl diphosphate synthase (flavodoxin) n=1 Tax=Oceanidesulfovibrio indonesiensis TaxID=54767 RepID=A0A7M3MG03_9BACT|nr:flavodoxin-dependent (E)-4-hydroxy-3-methylbut-2-enyl-diphosphate synthase [Oceanidesulfovibrio indonesiensis]TVM18252.1 4-hydroxy-3-methylbut-2-en-1-yl diphosphate synthase [Oceanidesulfovibrio indonesiensis]